MVEPAGQQYLFAFPESVVETSPFVESQTQVKVFELLIVYKYPKLQLHTSLLMLISAGAVTTHSAFNMQVSAPFTVVSY